jgi:tetratricopeptide (TPR) repeat protein
VSSCSSLSAEFKRWQNDRACVPGPVEKAKPGIGQALADQTVSSLAILSEELLPDLTLLKELKAQGARGAQATSHAAATLDAALSKSNDLKFGDVVVPLGAIVAPIQTPMRMILRVRVISGSLHEDQRGYTLLADSSSGENWRIQTSKQSLARRLSAAAEADTPCARSTPKAASSEVAVTALDAVSDIADQLAFRIRIEDPSFSELGMTRSWEAFKPFREGLAKWRRFELNHSYADLSEALCKFREATRLDPGFALAQYRLGLALQKDGQPGRSLEALRASLSASPDFLPALAGLATALWDFETFYFGNPAAIERIGDSAEARRARQSEARDSWFRLVRSPDRALTTRDRASANYGLCREAFQGLDLTEDKLRRATGILDDILESIPRSTRYAEIWASRNLSFTGSI